MHMDSPNLHNRTFGWRTAVYDHNSGKAMPSTRLPFLLPLLFLAVGTVAQEAPVRRWSLGASVGAGMGYRTLAVTGSSTMPNFIIDLRDDREKPLTVPGGQLSVAYQLTRRVGLEAGLGYVQMGWRQRISGDDLTFGDMIDPRRGFIYSTDDALLFDRITISDVFHYLELRLAATFTLGQGRWRSQTSAGIAPAFLLAARNRSTTVYEDGHRTHDSGKPLETFNTYNLFPYFATGLSFHPGGRWSWQLQPTVRYGALRIIDTPITAHLFSGTLDFGVRYTL